MVWSQLSKYIKNDYFTLDIIKFSPLTVEHILDNSPCPKRIKDVVLNGTNLLPNLMVTLSSDNIDPNELLSNVCRCRFIHY